MKTKMSCLTIFLGVFYLIGLGLLGWSLWSAWRSTQAANWPTTPGTITQLSVHESSDSDGGNTYEVKVQYAYSVDGAAYQGSRLAFGYTGSSGRQAHDEIHEKLKNAKIVTVRYDPADPAVACLSYGMHRSILLGLAFSITWLAFIVGLNLLMWLMSRGDSVLLENLSVQ
jgi:hypothetical protein